MTRSLCSGPRPLRSGPRPLRSGPRLGGRCLRAFAVRLDPAMLLIPAIGLVAVWPFLTQSLPSTDDGALHMLRLVEIDRCLRHGALPLRWAPDFAHGYGYPFFNYYASLSSYIAELWHLVGLSIPQAIAAATIAAFFVSGWGAYLLGRALAGRKAGLVAATAYMYAPYQFYDSAYRGNLAETWALALLPWVLWTGRRVAVGRHWREIVPFALAYGALITTHNVYALIGSPILGLYLVLLWWMQRPHVTWPAPRFAVTQRNRSVWAQTWGPRNVGPRTWRLAVRLAAALALGLALSAFFWLPALGEKGWTRFSTGLVDYRSFFLTFRELLAPPPQVDLSLLNYYPPRSLGWGMLALILATLVLLAVRAWRARSRHSASAPRREVLFFALVFLGAAWMTVRPSDFLWRTVPLLRFALIPWRFLGIASLAGSLVAGTVVALLPDSPTLRSPALIGTGSVALAAAAIVLLVATAIPWTYATPFPQRQQYGVAQIVGWEYSSKLIGTTAKNEYLPIWSPHLPPDPADPALLTEADPIIARLDPASLPEGATVVSADYALMRADLLIDTPRAFRARYKQLYFPGWRVTVDGQAVTPIAIAPYGLLGFEVPSGQHRIVVHPTTTPLRLLGNIASGLAAVTAVVMTVARPVSRVAPSPGEGEQVDDGSAGTYNGLHASRFTHHVSRHWLALVILAVLLLGVKEGLIDRTENLFRAHRFDPRQAPGMHLPGVQRETTISFGDVFTLHGYDLPRRPVVAGEPLRVDLYLSARQGATGEGEYMAYARLVDEEGRLWSRPDNGAPEGHRPPPPTAIWPTDAYAHWAYLAYTLPGTPPGEYWIQIGLFERGTWRGLNVVQTSAQTDLGGDDAGRIAGLLTSHRSVGLGPVEIVRPRRPPNVDALDIERPSQAVVSPELRCLGSKVDAGRTRAGDALNLTLFWQAVRPPAQDYNLRLALRTEEETFPLGDDLPLGRHDHPTSEWIEGEIVRSPHRLRVPAGAQAGSYVVEATVVDSKGQPIVPPFAVAEGAVEPTERQMAVPEDIQQRIDASLGAQVTLLGYDLPGTGADAQTSLAHVAPDESLSVTLYWQAQREMAVSYKVFVQLIGPQEPAPGVPKGVLAQVDAVPVGWQRPTTGWVPGEVIVDPYTLSIPADTPPGTYQLIVGLYDEGTLQRLAVVDALERAVGDHVMLKEIAVQ